MPKFADRIDIAGCETVRDTEKAILVKIPRHEGEVWIPRSQIDDQSHVGHLPGIGELLISKWIAEQKGLVCTKDGHKPGREN